MGVFYVRSTTGNDAYNGTSWNYAKATITGALNVATNGDTIYVSQSHNYTTGSGISYPAKGSVTSPILVVCVNDSMQPPVQVANTAIELNVSSGSDIVFTAGSYIYWFGINFKSARHIVYPYNTPTLPYENCSFQLLGSGGVWNLAPNGGSSIFNTYTNLQFINSSFIATYNNAYINFYNYWNWCYWPSRGWYTGTQSWMTTNTIIFKGCSFSGVIFNCIFNATSSNTFVNILVDGCDLSSLGTSSSLINNVTNFQPGSKFYFKNCKLNATANITNVIVTYPQTPDIYIDNCDSSGTNTRNEIYKYYGKVRSSTSVYRTGGASTGTLGYSYILETNSFVSFTTPMETPAISMWCKNVGVQKTASVAFVHDNDSPLGSTDIWAELQYSDSSTSPITSFLSTKVDTYPLFSNSSEAPPIDSNVVWTTAGLTNPTYQKFTFTFTPEMAGLIVIKVYLAKTNYVVYIDPMIILD